jgi:membrane dipeptidase
MLCCGHVLTRREWMWSAMLSSAGAMVGGGGGARAEAQAASAESLAAANTLLRDNVSVDVHTHAGPDGITSRTAGPSDEIARSMRAGRIAVLCLADVPDGPILGRNAQNVLVALRVPEPGLLWKHHLDRLAWADELVAKHGIRRVLTLADIKAAHAAGQPAVIFDVEGLDFLEKKLERLEESYARGVRTMQLVHYTPNGLGDFQTGAATRPLLLSHTALRGSRAQGSTPLTERQIAPDHARAIAETGGSVGIWHFFPSLERYVDGLKEMADVVGVNHVSIGTDTSRGTGLFPQYDHFPQLVDAMLRGGFTPADTAKIVGGNYLRIFAASVG